MLNRAVSAGHVCIIGDREYFQDGAEIFSAPVATPFPIGAETRPDATHVCDLKAWDFWFWFLQGV